MSARPKSSAIQKVPFVQMSLLEEPGLKKSTWTLKLVIKALQLDIEYRTVGAK